MTLKRLKRIIRRLPYYFKMQKKGKTVEKRYIGRRTEVLALDEEVLAVMEIMQDILNNEQEEWKKQTIKSILKGEKDITILAKGCPMGRFKFYAMKKALLHKIYGFCILKGLVSYEEILAEEIE